MTAFLYLQRFDEGAPAPMPFEALMEVLARHGVPGRGRGDMELTLEADQMAAGCTVIGDAAAGAACVGFERPRFDAALRRVVWECMATFGCTVFNDTLDTVYSSVDGQGALPSDFVAACVNGVRQVGGAQQLWPEQLELAVQGPPRPALLYPNPNGNGPNMQFCDDANFDTNELCIELRIHPAACNPGTLRVLRNLKLRVDAAISANPQYRILYRYAHHESSLRLMESAQLGQHANPTALASPPPGAQAPPPSFVVDRDVLAGAHAEAAMLARHVQEKYQLALDGGAASIGALATVLDKVHAYYRQQLGKHDGAAPFTSATATSWALRAGCYLGTVIEGQLGGQWGYVARGQQRLPAVRSGDGRICHPHLQALDHIINGPRASIATWYGALGRTDPTRCARNEDTAANDEPPADAAMAAALYGIRTALDDWRRHATPDDYLELREGDGGWLRDDPLGEILDAQAMLLSAGRVVWAALAKANGDLFEPGPDDQLAAMVHSLDPHFDGRPHALRRIARELCAPQGSDQPMELQVVAGRLARANDRFQNLPVPRVLTGQKAFVSVFMVFRQHLPGNTLAGVWFPVLAHPYTPAMMIVPRQFWPRELVTRWEAGDLND